MIQHDDYIEFDLKSIMFYILRRWKSIVVVTLAAAVMLGGLQAVTSYKNEKANSFEEQYQAYQEELIVYEDAVSDVQKEFDILQDYVDHSVRMQMDPQNVYIANTTYHIDSQDVAIPENYYQNMYNTMALLNHYRSFLMDSSFYEEISAAYGMEQKYLMELIEVPDNNSGMLSFSVMHSDKEVAQNILQDIQKKLTEVHDLLETTVQAHTLTEISTTCGTYVADSLKKDQANALEDLLKLQEELEEAQKEQNAYVKNNYPVSESISKVFVIWFVIGGVLGAFLSAVYLLFKAVLSNCLLSQDQLASNHTSAVLGEAICSNTSLPVIAKTLNKLEGCLTENTECNWQFIAQKIKLHCGSAKTILVCSDMGSDLSSMIVSPLSDLLPDLQLIPSANPLTDIASLRLIDECDMVLMVVARDKSKNKTVKKVLKLIQDYKKETAGFIITY